jgi:hypothetical protein
MESSTRLFPANRLGTVIWRHYGDTTQHLTAVECVLTSACREPASFQKDNRLGTSCPEAHATRSIDQLQSGR